jgi:hypothetical protein
VPKRLPWPLIVTACADCGVGTNRLGEWYMVHDHIWEQAWSGRRKSWQHLEGQEVLCIACLEKRLGRTLMASDFTDAPCNDPNPRRRISERLRARLTATERRRGRPKGSKNKRSGPGKAIPMEEGALGEQAP